MLTLLQLCVVAFATIHRVCQAQNEHSIDDATRIVGPKIVDISTISELGRSAEEKLNCFGAFDVELAEKWTKTLELERNDVATRLFAEEDQSLRNISTPPAYLVKLDKCMRNLIDSSNVSSTKTCMENLNANEIEYDGFISSAKLFDNTLRLPFLAFLNTNEVRDLLFQNRSGAELTASEKLVSDRITRLALTEEYNARDKVFVVDQSCEWKTLKEFTEAKTEEELFQLFKLNVLRTLALRLSRETLITRDLQPGRWFFVYNQWVPVRVENVKELDSIIEDLKGKKFTKRELCRYATTLGSHYARLESAILRAEKPTTIQIMTANLDGRSQEKLTEICQTRGNEECDKFRKLVDSYTADLECVRSFADLLTSHLLHAISLRYMDDQHPITYPEIFCKAETSYSGLVLRYCKCVGSFCSSQDAGELDANDYELVEGSRIVKLK